jgi:hypothetical protein
MEEPSEKDRDIYFQKVRKRMLRSKVKSLLEQEVSLYCRKHAMQNQSVEVPFLILSAFSLGDKAEIEGVRP